MLTTHHSQKTVQDLFTMWKSKQLNLSPAFQRQSVWGNKDRQLLVQSVLDGVPLPSIYLYRQMGRGGTPTYDVIDGKQRLETILLFAGKGPLAADLDLWVKRAVPPDDALEWKSWGDLANDVKHDYLTTKIDEIIKGAGLSAADLSDATAKVRRAFGFAEAVLPDLKTTRFRNGSDFYTLALLLHSFKEEGKTISKHASKRNALAGALLRDFGRGVDEANERLRTGKGLLAEQEPFREYLLTVRADTDSYKTRKSRERMLRQVLEHVFDDTDSCRLFNPTQRRIVWHSSDKKACTFCGKRIARWEDMAVDHVEPHSKGGKTRLSNAALAHKRCNSVAGDKRNG